MSTPSQSARAPSALLTVQETAELLRRHPSTIYRRLERGEWPFAWKDGNDWRIEREALMQHLRSHSIPTRRAPEDPMPKIHASSRARFRAILAQKKENP